MEKFKRFTDVATGINPFVFTAQQNRSPPASSKIVCALLFPLRALAFLFLAACLALVLGLRSLLGFVITAKLSGYALSPLVWLFCRLLLGCSFAGWCQPHLLAFPSKPSTGCSRFDGFGGQQTSAVNTSATRQQDGGSQPTTTTTDLIRTPSPGSVVFSNLISWLDILTLQALYPAAIFTFAFPVQKKLKGGGEAKTRVEVLTAASLFAALSLVSSTVAQGGADDAEGERGEEEEERSCRGVVDLALLQVAARRNGSCIVLFCEGTTSNGRGLLGFVNGSTGGFTLHADPVHKGGSFHCISLYHEQAHAAQVSSATPTSSLFPGRLYRTQLPPWTRHNIYVTMLRPSHTPMPFTAETLPGHSSVVEEWSDGLRDKICSGTVFAVGVCSGQRVAFKPLKPGVAEKRAYLRMLKEQQQLR